MTSVKYTLGIRHDCQRLLDEERVEYCYGTWEKVVSISCGA